MFLSRSLLGDSGDLFIAAPGHMHDIRLTPAVYRQDVLALI